MFDGHSTFVAEESCLVE